MKEIFYCENCGRELPAGTAVCPYCADELTSEQTLYCDSCGKPLPKGELFCPHCEKHPPRKENPSKKQIVESYENEDTRVGFKIARLIKAYSYIGLILGLVITIAYIVNKFENQPGEAVLFILIATFALLTLQLFIYGFGIIIEKLTVIAKNTSKKK